MDRNQALLSFSESIGHSLKQLGWRVGTAESCTGGLVAAAITDIAGSSQWFDEGFVTYSNASKRERLGVCEHLLDTHGAVSAEVVEAMVAGVLSLGADVAVATSGIAGPDGGSREKPVGTVWMAWALAGEIESEVKCFKGDRAGIRQLACEYVLGRLSQRLESVLNS